MQFTSSLLRYFVMDGLSGSAIFIHIIYYAARFLGKKLPNIKRVFCFSLQILSATFLFLRRIQRMLSLMYGGLYAKFPLFLSDVNESWIFWTDFGTNFMKIRPVEAELCHADGRTDGRDEPAGCFSQFCECV